MNITISGEITISNNAESTFQYISNLKNDPFWRKEINGTEMTSLPQLHARARESSYLSKKQPANVLELECIAFIDQQKIVYQTLSTSPFYLKSTREVKAISANETQFKYSIIFDKNIVKHGLGFSLPSFIIKMAAQSDMKKYLKKLKEILEK